MSQQNPFERAGSQYPHRPKKKLFVDNGFEWVEVQAKIINPYQAPSPQLNSKEIRIINAPSHFHQGGIASYKLVLNILFDSREEFDNYAIYAGWTHKFYDERGGIYVGSLDSIRAEPVEASRRYKVELSLTLIRKHELDDRQDTFKFVDLVDSTGKEHWGKNDIEEMANLGLVTVMTNDGQPVLYFRPNDYITRAEYVAFINRTRKLLERLLRE